MRDRKREPALFEAFRRRKRVVALAWLFACLLLCSLGCLLGRNLSRWLELCQKLKAGRESVLMSRARVLPSAKMLDARSNDSTDCCLESSSCSRIWRFRPSAATRPIELWSCRTPHSTLRQRRPHLTRGLSAQGKLAFFDRRSP